MKSLFVVVLFLMSGLTYGQLTAGEITYAMFLDSEDEDNQKANELVEQSSYELFFMPNRTRTSIRMGEDMSMTTIIDSKIKKGLIIMTGMMGDLAITTTHEELTNSNHKAEIEIEFFDQTKVIQGYTCKKAKITTATGTIITYWYTDKIQFNTSGIENMFAAIPGVPLEYRIESDGESIYFSAVSIKTNIDDLDALFSTLPPAGYTNLTMEQFEAGQF